MVSTATVTGAGMATFKASSATGPVAEAEAAGAITTAAVVAAAAAAAATTAGRARNA